MSERDDARERVRAALLRRLDEGAELAELALWLAAEHDPDLSVADALGDLDALGDAARTRLADRSSAADRLAALDDFLYRECGFCGNRDDYYDPKNSDLHCVLERRTGIPITLAIVYLAVARRCAVPVEGVSFPGHFLLRSGDDPRLFVDPFAGELLSRRDCEQRLRDALGDPELELDPRLLEPADEREILARVLRNLKQIHLAQRDLPAALADSERILLLRDAASVPHELRDRGLIQARLECFEGAIADLERFLELAPGDESAAAVREELERLHASRPALH